jgi:membrane protein DedA with SNARE-associated domain
VTDVGRAPSDGSRKSRGISSRDAWRILALLLVVAASAIVYLLRSQVAGWATYGYLGVFAASVLASGTVLLPAPGVVLVFALGGVLNPLLVSFAAGMGAAVGELVGYTAGFGGQVIVERVALYDRLLVWMRRYGAVTILVLAAIPNPFFDLAGIAAGSLRMPVQRFFMWCLLGKILKMLAFAYSGALVVHSLGGLK